MIDLIIIEAIMLSSFIFTSWIFLSEKLGNTLLPIIFLLTVALIVFGALLKDKKDCFFLSTTPLLFMSLFIKDTFLLSLFIVVVSVFYMTQIYDRTSTKQYSNGITVSYWILFSYIVIKQIQNPWAKPILVVSPYLTLYVFSSLLFMRTHRHIAAGLNKDKIRQHNIFYAIISSITFFILSKDSVRQIFEETISTIADYALKPLNYLAQKFANWYDLSQLEKMKTGTVATTELNEGVSSRTTFVPPPSNESSVFYYIIMGFLLIIALIALSIIIYKLVTKSNAYKTNNSDISEERESLEIDENKRKKRLFGLLGEKYPKESKEQIRYWYRKYLERLESLSIYKETLTSEELMKNSEEFSDDKVLLEDIHKHYIKNRYNDDEVTKDDVLKMKQLIKSLNLKKNK